MFDLSDVTQRGKGRKGAAQEASSLSSPLHRPSRFWRQADEEEQTGEAGSGEYAEEEYGSVEEGEDGYGEEEDEEDVSEGSSDQVSTVFCWTSHSVTSAYSWGQLADVLCTC